MNAWATVRISLLFAAQHIEKVQQKRYNKISPEQALALRHSRRFGVMLCVNRFNQRNHDVTLPFRPDGIVRQDRLLSLTRRLWVRATVCDGMDPDEQV